MDANWMILGVAAGVLLVSLLALFWAAMTRKRIKAEIKLMEASSKRLKEMNQQIDDDLAQMAKGINNMMAGRQSNPERFNSYPKSREKH